MSLPEVGRALSDYYTYEEGMMRQHHTGRWITAGSLFLLLAVVATGELLLLTSRPGTHLLPSHYSLSALFRAWR